MKKFVLFCLLAGAHQFSNAWIMCLPFCDSVCGAPALVTLSVNTGTALQKLTLENQKLVQPIADLTQSIVNLGTTISIDWNDDTLELLSGFDAEAAKTDLTYTVGIKAREESTNKFVNAAAQALRQSYIAKAVVKNASTYSDRAMPETGDVAVGAAEAFKETYFKVEELTEGMSATQALFAEEVGTLNEGVATAAFLTLPDDIYKGYVGATTKTLSDDELTHAQMLVAFMTNSPPLPVLTEDEMTSTKAHKYELQRRIHNAKTQIVGTILNEINANKAQFADDDIVRSYVSRTSEEEKLSMSEMLDAIINGRVTSDGWHLNIKLLSEPGIQREAAFLKAEENALLFMLIRRREWRNQLLALIASSSIAVQLEALKYMQP